MPIPEWNDIGALPPFVGHPTDARECSPYPAPLAEVAARFGDSPERRRLLFGLMDYRAELHQAGLVSGFQWVDGSFVEDIKWQEDREPRDLDVVTFCRLPDGQTSKTLEASFPALFTPAKIKRLHSVDARIVLMEPEKLEEVIGLAAYWEGLWGHRRDGRRKGYLQVDLSRDEDEAARRALDARDAEEGRR